MRNRLLFVGLILLSLITRAKGATTQKPLAHRWIYAAYNLQVDENVGVLTALMKRVKAAGYNGIVLADYKLTILDRVPDNYFTNARKIIQAAKTLGMDIYPTVAPIGYSNGLLSHDPNLAEGQPVKEALFVAKNGVANLAPDPPIELKGGDFETASANLFAGWSFQDLPGKCTFIDHEIKHGGDASLRMEKIGEANPDSGNSRVNQTVTVSPYRQYHLSVWIKTEGFETPENVQGLILSPQSEALSYNQWSIKSTQDWTRYDLIFNSQGYRQILVYLGAWGGKGGKIWWDDARLEEVGLMNVLRRDGCPLVVKGEDGTVYREGVDYQPLKDDRMGMIPWAGEYETFHDSPVIRLTQNSRIYEGQKLRVSFYHAVVVYQGQVTCCLSDPKVYALLQDEITRVNQLFHPKGFFMEYDEIRVANWCETCQKRKLTPGQLLADNASRCEAMIRAANSKAEIYVWSDMFDPYHNAHDHYYLANGTWAGSWEGLSKDTGIVNWYFDKRKQNMPWFAKRGHSQILAGYYDGPVETIRTWLTDSQKIPNVTGVMYTTWRSDYTNIEAFAKAAWGAEN